MPCALMLMLHSLEVVPGMQGPAIADSMQTRLKANKRLTRGTIVAIRVLERVTISWRE